MCIRASKSYSTDSYRVESGFLYSSYLFFFFYEKYNPPKLWVAGAHTDALALHCTALSSFTPAFSQARAGGTETPCSQCAEQGRR